jgi:hypothetical protein
LVSDFNDGMEASMGVSPVNNLEAIL